MPIDSSSDGPAPVNTAPGLLPEGFQLSEFVLDHGMIDVIVERARLRPFLARLLTHFETGAKA